MVPMNEFTKVALECNLKFDQWLLRLFTRDLVQVPQYFRLCCYILMAVNNKNFNDTIDLQKIGNREGETCSKCYSYNETKHKTKTNSANPNEGEKPTLELKRKARKTIPNYRESGQLSVIGTQNNPQDVDGGDSTDTEFDNHDNETNSISDNGTSSFHSASTNPGNNKTITEAKDDLNLSVDGISSSLTNKNNRSQSYRFAGKSHSKKSKYYNTRKSSTNQHSTSNPPQTSNPSKGRQARIHHRHRQQNHHDSTAAHPEIINIQEKKTSSVIRNKISSNFTFSKSKSQGQGKGQFKRHGQGYAQRYRNQSQNLHQSQVQVQTYVRTETDASDSDSQHIKNTSTLTTQPTEPLPNVPIDPFIKRIQEYHLPVVWIIGEPTIPIKYIVRNFCEQLADALAFKYINLDDKIGEWYEREALSNPTRFWQKLQDKKLIQRERRDRDSRGIASSPNKNKQEAAPQLKLTVVPPIRGCQIKATARLSGSLTNHAIMYDKKVKKLLNQSPHQNQGGSSILPKNETSQLFNNHRKLGEIEIDTKEPLKREKLMDVLKYAMVEFLHSSMSTRGFIIDGSFYDRLDFVKFKHMFYTPTVGLYFTESPVNQGMAKYKLALKALSDQAKVLKSTMDETERFIRSKVTVAKLRNFRRIKQYSFIEADSLCDEFKDKIVRIVNAEHLNWSTIKYINSLVKTHLEHSNKGHGRSQGHDKTSTLLNSYPKSTPEREKDLQLYTPTPQSSVASVYQKKLQEMKNELDTEKSSHLSTPTLKQIENHDDKDKQKYRMKKVKHANQLGVDSVSPNVKPNSKVDTKIKEILPISKQSFTAPVISDNIGSVTQFSNATSINQVSNKLQELKDQNDDIAGSETHTQIIELEFEKLRHRKLPIIWIYGYKQTSIASQRQSCCVFLAKYFNFAFVQMDEQIVKWYRYSLKKIDNSKIDNVHELIFHGAKRIIRSVIPSAGGSSKNNNNPTLSELTKRNFLTRTESLTLIKYAMIHSMPTNGFIIDQFPLNSAEGIEFENFIYPVALGIYFSSGNNTSNTNGPSTGVGNGPRSQKKVLRPKYFRTESSSVYTENLMHKLCKDFHAKTIKILNIEEIQPEGMREICGMVSKHIDAFNKKHSKTISNSMGHKPNTNPTNQNDVLSDIDVGGGISPTNNNNANGKDFNTYSKKVTNTSKLKKLKDSWTQPEIIIMKHTSLPHNLNVNYHTSLQNADNVDRPKRPNQEYLFFKTKRPGNRSPSPVMKRIPAFSKIAKGRRNYLDCLDTSHNKGIKYNPPAVPAVIKLWEGKNIHETMISNSQIDLAYNISRNSAPQTILDSEDPENEVSYLMNPKVRVSDGGNFNKIPSILGVPTGGWNSRAIKSNVYVTDREKKGGKIGLRKELQKGWLEAQVYINNIKHETNAFAKYGGKGENKAGTSENAGGRSGKTNNTTLPKVSVPSTIYETANSSEDDFDEDDNSSEVTLSKTSTIQGLIFGADGRKSKNGLITPNSQLMAVTISNKNSEMQFPRLDTGYETLEEYENMKHQHHQKNKLRHGKEFNSSTGRAVKNRTKLSKFFAGFFGVFRRRSKARTPNT